MTTCVIEVCRVRWLCGGLDTLGTGAPSQRIRRNASVDDFAVSLWLGDGFVDKHASRRIASRFDDVCTFCFKSGHSVDLMLTRTAVRLARIVGGIAFLILGVVGLFLPFLQGVLFLVIGLTLLSQESERARILSEWLRERLPVARARNPRSEEK